MTKGIGFPLMIQQALDMHSEESGVPLSADARYVQVRVQMSGNGPFSLLDCMGDIQGKTDGIWVPRGDGYHLTRDE